ncbi:Zn-dependent hydrolase [Paenibacillus sp. MMS20-IR301]|uniref:Zn-dependent hydrolase n=1 Tax=Paenibacillus sp. MMS20-IR301 TaxID=2895946 RepID=UPI0028EB3591|nr:Zn-dependent hydrolase [Paenibacillus sp. MMS20-IR301]WNS41203.1 Zn-dependent hydrolase [Paenibacillus sp. MMS20-IR301]
MEAGLSKEKSGLRINAERLQHNIRELGMFGLNEATGGLDRTTFTPAELAAREWLKGKLLELELAVRVDEAANIWAVRSGVERADPPEALAASGGLSGSVRAQGSLPVIAFGSHIDTVPNGGKYDGALGVLLALEVMTVLHENRISTRHPLELVSFSAEEPNPFGLSTFGSRAVSGKLKQSDLAGVRSDQGQLLAEALRLAGGDPEQFGSCRREPAELAAFLEVHIEQGKRLLDRGIPVGIVTAITGIYREEVTVTGEANHAGTTLMSDRKDALTGASEMMLAFEAVCRKHPADEAVGTIGRIRNEPNAANIIPEQVSFHLEARGAKREQIGELLRAWGSEASDIAARRGLHLKRQLILDQAPQPMDALVMEVCAAQAEVLGIASLQLGSMAGHDATHMASLTRAGMLFVPSLGGKSHCPEEESRITDIEQAGNVLLQSILALDGQLR